jgi:hypothetical protein
VGAGVAPAPAGASIGTLHIGLSVEGSVYVGLLGVLLLSTPAEHPAVPPRARDKVK